MWLTIPHLSAPPSPVAVAPDVHPVPAPALAVARARQEPIDDLLVRIATLIGAKVVKLFDRRRQADKVQIDPAQQGCFIGGRPWLQAMFVMFARDKGIDGIAHPAWILHRWQRGLLDFVERPPGVSSFEFAESNQR